MLCKVAFLLVLLFNGSIGNIQIGPTSLLITNSVRDLTCHNVISNCKLYSKVSHRWNQVYNENDDVNADVRIGVSLIPVEGIQSKFTFKLEIFDNNTMIYDTVTMTPKSGSDPYTTTIFCSVSNIQKISRRIVLLPREYTEYKVVNVFKYYPGRVTFSCRHFVADYIQIGWIYTGINTLYTYETNETTLRMLESYNGSMVCCLLFTVRDEGDGKHITRFVTDKTLLIYEELSSVDNKTIGTTNDTKTQQLVISNNMEKRQHASTTANSIVTRQHETTNKIKQQQHQISNIGIRQPEKTNTTEIQNETTNTNKTLQHETSNIRTRQPEKTNTTEIQHETRNINKTLLLETSNNTDTRKHTKPNKTKEQKSKKTNGTGTRQQEKTNGTEIEGHETKTKTGQQNTITMESVTMTNRVSTEDEGREDTVVPLYLYLVIAMIVAAILTVLVIVAVKKRCCVKSDPTERPQLPIPHEAFYVNLLFREDCQRQIEETERHLYEEIHYDTADREH